MASDLVERLRNLACQSNDGVLRGPALEAADEIERLRKGDNRQLSEPTKRMEQVLGAPFVRNGDGEREAIARDDAVRFLEATFRNIDLPALGTDDIEDVRDGLQHFLHQHRSNGSAKCSCMEVFGEDPNCIQHGRGTDWHKANPDICELAERLKDAEDALATPNVTPIRGLVERLIADRISNYQAMRDERVEARIDENEYALVVEALERLQHDIAALTSKQTVSVDQEGYANDPASIWRCAIGDMITVFDIAIKPLRQSKRKAEREIGERLNAAITLVFDKSRNEDPQTYDEAMQIGKQMVALVSALPLDGESAK